MIEIMEKDKQNVSRLVVIVGVLLGLFLLVGTAYKLRQMKYLGSGAPGATIQVSGYGKLEKAPDTAKFSFTVSDEQKDVTVAQTNVSAKIDTLKKDLIAAGVDEKYITTDAYNSYPQYDYKQPSMYGNPSGVIRGYMVSQNVNVSVKDLSKIEEVAGILGKDGAASISGPNLGFEDDKAVARDARDMAIEDAREQAQKLARSLGVHLVRVVSFSENGGGGYPTPVAYDMAKSSVGAAAPSIPTGVQTVESNVTVTYEIR